MLLATNQKSQLLVFVKSLVFVLLNTEKFATCFVKNGKRLLLVLLNTEKFPT